MLELGLLRLGLWLGRNGSSDFRGGGVVRQVVNVLYSAMSEQIVTTGSALCRSSNSSSSSGSGGASAADNKTVNQ